MQAVTVEVVWSRLAGEDVRGIYLGLMEKNPGSAERLLDRIEERVRQLADLPRLGPRRPEIRPTTRVLVEAPYLILYETIPDADDRPVEEVEIVRVLDGRRDLSMLF